MSYLKDTPASELEKNFEAQAKKAEDDFGDMPFILSGLEEKDKELEEKIESGKLTCNLNDDEHCESCSG